MSRILSNKLRIYTAVWDTKYIDLLKNTLLRSLNWPENYKAIEAEDTVWTIHTKKKDRKAIEKVAKMLPVGSVEVAFIDDTIQAVKDNLANGGGCDMGAVLLNHFIAEIDVCLRTNSKLLMAPPDSLFGDGSLKNIFKLGAQDNVCVSVAHPRVVPTILDKMFSPYNNKQLVTASFKHLHKTWTEAKLGLEFINSYVGGVQWDEIDKGLYKVQHHLPTPYLLHFNETDLEFYKKQITFGVIDHIWGVKLFQEERLRVCGSSDICFVCEVTAPCQNIPPKYPVIKSNPDRFWRSAYHNQIYKQFVFTFRGE